MSLSAVNDVAPTLQKEARFARPATPRKNKSLNLILVVVIVALLIASVVRSSMQSKPVSTVTVVAAARDLPPGMKVGFRDLHYLTIPKSYFATSMSTAYTDLVGRTTNTFIAMGEPIVSSAVLPKNFGIAEVLAPNQRAMTIKVPPEDMVDNQIRPGDRVDIITVTTADSGKKFTKTVAQDVVVLMSAPKELTLSDRLRAGEPDKLTLAVSADDAETLTQACEVSKVHVVLRSGGNHAVASLAGADDADLLPLKALRAQAADAISQDRAAQKAFEPLPAPPTSGESLPATDVAPAPVQWLVDVFKGAMKESHEVPSR